jgi:uncharacterized membrane-anchored protein
MPRSQQSSKGRLQMELIHREILHRDVSQSSGMSSLLRGFTRLLAVSALVLSSSLASALAQDDTSKAARIEAEGRAAFDAANKVAQTGPVSIKLSDQAEIALPAGYIFVPQPEAGRVMRANGNSEGKDLLGLFFPAGGGRQWFATIEFKKSGYVKDDEAKNWDSDALLKNLQDGTEAGNADRVERGFPPFEVTGWLELPAYDAAAHHLVWSAKVRNKNDASDEGSINYNTYALGRDGYFSLDLITAPGAIAIGKADANTLLASIAFADGKTYADFNASTDHIAEFGIAALVGGLAVKKLGLLAVAGVFLLKAWKIVLIGLAVFGTLGRKVVAFFTPRKKPEPRSPEAQPQPPEAQA